MLDRSKPYAEVYGDVSGIRFEQDGRYFNAGGDEIQDALAKQAAAEQIFDAEDREKQKEAMREEVRREVMAELAGVAPKRGPGRPPKVKDEVDRQLGGE
jgi:hypothetical protein